MRDLPPDGPDGDSERKDLARLNAEPWMVAQLACNPSYNGWAPGDDAMPSNSGTDSWFGSVLESWSEFRDGSSHPPDHLLGHGGWRRFDGTWGLDDHNVCASFYFELERDSEPCPECPEYGEGYNRATAALAASFQTWRYQLTQDELEALIAERRVGVDRTLAQINRPKPPAAVSHDSWFPDAISRHILIERRATRLGVYGVCPTCDGSTYRFTEPAAHLNLVLWMLYPRKGASAATTIRNLSRADAKEARDFLREAAKQNAERFGQLEEPNDATEDEVSDERYRKAEEIAVAWMDRADRWRRGGVRKATGT